MGSAPTRGWQFVPRFESNRRTKLCDEEVPIALAGDGANYQQKGRCSQPPFCAQTSIENSVTKTVQPQDIREGAAHPRGATFIGEGVNFVLFSAHATTVDVCLFDESGGHKLNGSTTERQAHGG
jgi:hypothetical protein